MHILIALNYSEVLSGLDSGSISERFGGAALHTFAQESGLNKWSSVRAICESHASGATSHIEQVVIHEYIRL